MGGLPDQAEANAELFRPLHRNGGALHRRDRAEAVTGFEHEGGGAIMNEMRFRLGVDLAFFEHFQITRQPRHAMAVAAAQIGPDQAFGDDAGVACGCTMRDQQLADETPELLVTDGHSFVAHSVLSTYFVIGKYLSSQPRSTDHTRVEFSANRK